MVQPLLCAKCACFIDDHVVLFHNCKFMLYGDHDDECFGQELDQKFEGVHIAMYLDGSTYETLTDMDYLVYGLEDNQ